MIDLVPEISEMLDEIIEQYEEDTDKETDHENMVSGLIRLKHADLVAEGVL